MKRLIVLFLALSIWLSLAQVVSAATIYLDGSLNGKLDNTVFEDDYNLMSLGADIPFDNWKISLEYFSGTWKWHYYDYDVSGYTLKAGYALINSDSTQLYLNLGLYRQDFDSNIEDLCFNNDLTIGMESVFNLSNKVNLDLSYDTLLTGHYQNSLYPGENFDIQTLELYKIDLNYRVTDNLGFALGFRSTIEKPKPGIFYKFTLSSFTLGMRYYFK